MRCYYVRGGHIVDVDEVSGPSDEEAIGKAQALFSEREDLFERLRVVGQRPFGHQPYGIECGRSCDVSAARGYLNTRFLIV